MGLGSGFNGDAAAHSFDKFLEQIFVEGVGEEEEIIFLLTNLVDAEGGCIPYEIIGLAMKQLFKRS